MIRRFYMTTICTLALLLLSACGGMDAPEVPTPHSADTSVSQDAPTSVHAPIETPDEAKQAESAMQTESTIQEAIQAFEPAAPVEAGEIPVSGTETPAQTTPPSNEIPPTESERKVLIAYFTWAENTVVEDPSAVDVDATTSASVLAPGHVAQMASWIQAETGGDLFSIVSTDPYSSDYDECLDRAADEKADNARPALSGSVANMADYDVVFLGYPDWWATCPMAVFTFLDSYDFTGKTVIPFCAHGTSGLASSVRDIKAALPNVTVLDAVGVQRPGMDTPIETARSTVTSWLTGLKY